jgi:hypothetical protein
MRLMKQKNLTSIGVFEIRNPTVAKITFSAIVYLMRLLLKQVFDVDFM